MEQWNKAIDDDIRQFIKGKADTIIKQSIESTTHSTIEQFMEGDDDAITVSFTEWYNWLKDNKNSVKIIDDFIVGEQKLLQKITKRLSVLFGYAIPSNKEFDVDFNSIDAPYYIANLCKESDTQIIESCSKRKKLRDEIAQLKKRVYNYKGPEEKKTKEDLKIVLNKKQTKVETYDLVIKQETLQKFVYYIQYYNRDKVDDLMHNDIKRLKNLFGEEETEEIKENMKIICHYIEKCYEQAQDDNYDSKRSILTKIKIPPIKIGGNVIRLKSIGGLNVYNSLTVNDLRLFYVLIEKIPELDSKKQNVFVALKKDNYDILSREDRNEIRNALENAPIIQEYLSGTAIPGLRAKIDECKLKLESVPKYRIHQIIEQIDHDIDQIVHYINLCSSLSDKELLEKISGIETTLKNGSACLTEVRKQFDEEYHDEAIYKALIANIPYKGNRKNNINKRKMVSFPLTYRSCYRKYKIKARTK